MEIPSPTADPLAEALSTRPPAPALSTSWAAGEASLARWMARLGQFSIHGVELDYRIPAALAPDLIAGLRAGGTPVVSVHNFFPFPLDRRLPKPSGDLFLLSSPDPEARQRAVAATERTLQYACEAEAGRVVLHCGAVAMDPALPRLFQGFRTGDADAVSKLLAVKTVERDRLKGPHMEALCFSLDRLVRRAEALGVVLGLENRYHYHELPGIDDFDRLFSEFDGGPIGYWHDTGHAHALERLSVIPPGALLDRYGHRLVGIHVHDARGLDDHRPPGTGEIDFSTLTPYLTPETHPVVVELAPGTPDDAAGAGIDAVTALLQKATAASPKI